MAVTPEQSARFIVRRRKRQDALLDVRFDAMRHAAERIVAVIAQRYRPTRVYQWGSLLDRSRFRRYSDVDIAVSENFYTGAETILLRISQYFENALEPERWHRELLHKMTLEVPEIRPRLVSEETFSDLEELLRFRHFRRYYLQFEYNWDKLRVVESAYVRARDRLDDELRAFESFLGEIAERL